MTIGKIYVRTIRVGYKDYYGIPNAIADAIMNKKNGYLTTFNIKNEYKVPMGFDEDCVYLVQDEETFDLIDCDDEDFFSLTDYICDGVLRLDILTKNVLDRVEEIRNNY